MLSIFGVSSTGVNFYRSSLDAIAHNVANLNTVRARDELAVQRQVVVGSANEAPAPGVVGAGGVVGSGVSFRVAHGSSTDNRHSLNRHGHWSTLHFMMLARWASVWTVQEERPLR